MITKTAREIERLTRTYHQPGTGSAIRARIAAELATAWQRQAEEDAQTAREVVARTSAAFDDGMTYVPGRGRVRNDAPPGSTT